MFTPWWSWVLRNPQAKDGQWALDIPLGFGEDDCLFLAAGWQIWGCFGCFCSKVTVSLLRENTQQEDVESHFLCNLFPTIIFPGLIFPNPAPAGQEFSWTGSFRHLGRFWLTSVSKSVYGKGFLPVLLCVSCPLFLFRSCLLVYLTALPRHPWSPCLQSFGNCRKGVKLGMKNKP